MSFASLTSTRERILASLIDLCRDSPDLAANALGLGPTQTGDVALNTTLLERPSAPAIRVYAGVLFEALDYPTLTARARRRAQTWVAISSGLWGLVRVTDRIPAYRLSGGTTLPGLGTLASAWRERVASEIQSCAGPIIDLRSSTYAALGPVPVAARRRTITVRVLAERDGKRTIVSHMNKATKGRVLRAALESEDTIRSADDMVDALHEWGYVCELVARAQPSASAAIDVIVREL